MLNLVRIWQAHQVHIMTLKVIKFSSGVLQYVIDQNVDELSF